LAHPSDLLPVGRSKGRLPSPSGRWLAVPRDFEARRIGSVVKRLGPFLWLIVPETSLSPTKRSEQHNLPPRLIRSFHFWVWYALASKRDRLLLDRELPQQESRIGLGTTPVDIDEASTFTLEAELVRLSGLLREKAGSKSDQKTTSHEIRTRMKQAEEDRDKLSERGMVAFNYLRTHKPAWDEPR